MSIGSLRLSLADWSSPQRVSAKSLAHVIKGTGDGAITLALSL